MDKVLRARRRGANDVQTTFSRRWRAAKAAAVAVCLWGVNLSPALRAAKPGAAMQPAAQVLRGKLVQIRGAEPVLLTAGKHVMLAGMNHFIFQTLQDKRLANDLVELHGHELPNGFFQVDRLYTLHHGRRYWVRYYCETCNIAALGPGRCVCCQHPTELQEIPVGVPGGPDPQGVIITH